MRQKIITASLLLATSINAFAGTNTLSQKSMYDSWVYVPGHYDTQYPDLTKGYYPSVLEPILGKSIDLTRGYYPSDFEALSEKTTTPEMTFAQKLNFADLAYKAEKNDPTIYNQMVQQLNNEGWAVKRLKGTTGIAQNQTESTMGIIAFRGKEVVISIRGTKMKNADDWITDFRFDRDIFGKLYANLIGNQEFDLKNEAIGAQFLGVNGNIHNGFLQTHLSMWPEIRQAILDYANSLDCQVSDLKFQTIGHSLGGAQQDLILVHLLNDSQLGLGKETLEASSIDTEIDQSLSESAWHLTKRTIEVENK